MVAAADRIGVVVDHLLALNRADLIFPVTMEWATEGRDPIEHARYRAQVDDLLRRVRPRWAPGPMAGDGRVEEPSARRARGPGGERVRGCDRVGRVRDWIPDAATAAELVALAAAVRELSNAADAAGWVRDRRPQVRAAIRRSRHDWGRRSWRMLR